MEQTFWFLNSEQPFDQSKGVFNRMPFTFCGKNEAIAFALGCGISKEWNPIHVREFVNPEYVNWIKSCVFTKEEMQEKYKESDGNITKSLTWPPTFE